MAEDGIVSVCCVIIAATPVLFSFDKKRQDLKRDHLCGGGQAMIILARTEVTDQAGCTHEDMQTRSGQLVTRWLMGALAMTDGPANIEYGEISALGRGAAPACLRRPSASLYPIFQSTPDGRRQLLTNRAALKCATPVVPSS